MNSDNNSKPDIHDQAADWVMKNDRGLSAAEQDAYTDWLSESSEHREAYAEHRFAWAELSRLAGLQNTDFSPVVPDLLGMAKTPSHQKIKNFPAWSVALSAAALITFVAGYFLLNQLREQNPPSEIIQLEVVNQIKQHQLEDGSVVDLNKGAEIQTFINREERLVKLISGEANFNVEKDPSRPFIVEAYGVRVRAVGTIFNVRMADHKVDVVVTEGTVVVQHPKSKFASNDAPIEESMVRRNFRAIIDLQPEIPQVSVDSVNETDLDAELLWQPRLIDFENAPLSQIVDEFNQRNPSKIEIHDEEIGSLRFTSIFWSHNVESFVRLLEANYEITAEVISENRISLKKSQASL